MFYVSIDDSCVDIIRYVLFPAWWSREILQVSQTATLLIQESLTVFKSLIRAKVVVYLGLLICDKCITGSGKLLILAGSLKKKKQLNRKSALFCFSIF